MALTAPEIADVTGDFDTESDVLYLSLGQPVPSYSEERPEGIVFRWAYADKRPSGVTVIGYRAHHWRVRIKELSELAAAHLNVDWHMIKAEIRRVT
jgi:hypothetical protein